MRPNTLEIYKYETNKKWKIYYSLINEKLICLISTFKKKNQKIKLDHGRTVCCRSCHADLDL